MLTNRKIMLIIGGIAILLIIAVIGIGQLGTETECAAILSPYLIHVALPDASIAHYSITFIGPDGKQISVSCPQTPDYNATPVPFNALQASCRPGEAVFTNVKPGQATILANWPGVSLSWVVQPDFRRASHICSGGQANISLPKSAETAQPKP
jgi:hypothetical protein